MIRPRKLHLIILTALVLTGCAAPTAGRSTAEIAPQPAEPAKTLVVATRAEPPSLSPKPFRSTGLTGGLAGRMFNAGLTILDDAGVPTPYLAEALPRLDTDTWRVFPDGTMETTYRLRPNITWHDGQTLGAGDFVFGYQILLEPVFAINTSAPGTLIDRVTAPDDRTVVVRWKQTYPEADGLLQAGLPAFPRHLLEQPFRAMDAEGFMAQQYWTQQYVGLGPYKLDKWEIGSFYEGVAFDHHVLGKAKIPRIREVVIGDPNTAMANIMSGAAQMTSGDSIRFTDGETLRARWGDKGRILNFSDQYRISQFQWRPEYASTLAFTDLRVRQALAHGIDFPTVNEAVQGGRADQALGPIPPQASYFAQLERAVAKFPYEPRRTEQLMLDAGFVKAGDGVWMHSTNPRFGRMAFETNVLANPDSENEMHIMADAWRRLGFDVKEVVWGPAVGQDRQARATFPGLSTTSTGSGENALASFRSDRVGTAEKRWQGNFHGWPGHPEYDRYVDIFETSLDRNVRVDAVLQLSRIWTEQLPVMPLYFKLKGAAVANGVVGPRLTDPKGSDTWNIHEWEYR